jgi:hypothetical protein
MKMTLSPIDIVDFPSEGVSLKGLLAELRAGERDMSWRILGQDEMGKLSGEPVDRRNDCVTVRHRERPAGTEIVLHVNDHQKVATVGRPTAQVLVHFSLADLWSD